MYHFQECQGIDLDDASISAVQAHLANLTGSITDLTSQDYIMATSNDSLDSMEGKVIKIVSLDQDGGILSLVDGNHMQVVGGDMLHSNAIQVCLHCVIIIYYYLYARDHMS